MRKTISQLVLLVAFLCVAFIAIQTIWKSTAPLPYESFTNSSGVERADKCRCLPGYIPYKADSGSYSCLNLKDSSFKTCY
jgi:hypothetical protein